MLPLLFVFKEIGSTFVEPLLLHGRYCHQILLGGPNNFIEHDTRWFRRK